MNALGNGIEVRQEQGFDLYVLGNREIEVAVVPELGAKIISLKNLRSGREWMWHPDGGLKLFRNRPEDDFAASPLVGLDECLPTISPCIWQGQQLPDHGELWNVAWQIDPLAREQGVVRTSVRMKSCPFDFARTVELNADEIRLTYRLINRSEVDQRYLWALHPLLRLVPGDQLELPPTTRALLNGAHWISDLNAAKLTGDCAKVFVTSLQEGRAAICNRRTGDRLEFSWSPTENNALGLWLTRGGWHGHEHFALEPTNGDADALTEAATRNCGGTVTANGTATWQVALRVGHNSYCK
jgi:galactose mutarotase-like enzyme